MTVSQGTGFGNKVIIKDPEIAEVSGTEVFECYYISAIIMITAEPAPGYVFTGWSGTNIGYKAVQSGGIWVESENGSSDSFTIRNDFTDENPIIYEHDKQGSIIANFTSGNQAHAPLPPASISASDGTYNDRVYVSWSASSGATSYNIYRSTSISGLKTVMGETSSTNFNDTSAICETTYYYWVMAINLYGTSDLSAYNSGYCESGVVTPPVDPPSGGVSQLSADQAKDIIDESLDLIILDARENSYYETGHLLCAENMVWNSAFEFINYNVIADYKSTDILLYDQDGTDAASAANYLAYEGFSKIYYMVGGLDAWTARGYETVTTNGPCSIPPMANTGEDQNAFEGDLVSLDGSNSSAFSGILTYVWTQTSGPFVVLLNPATAAPTFTAPMVQEGGEELIFHLKVINTQQVADVDSVSVFVTWNPANSPPVAEAGVDQTLNERASVILNASGSTDADDDIKSYSWTQTAGTPSVTLSKSPSSPIATFTAPDISAEQTTLAFRVTVEDDEGNNDSDQMQVTIMDADNFVDPKNDPPIANAGVDQEVKETGMVVLDGSGSSDSDGDLSYFWTQILGPAVILSDVSAKSPTFSVPVVNSDDTVLEFRLMVEDNDGLIDMDEVSISIKNDDSVTVSSDCNARDVSQIQINVFDSSDTLLAAASFPCSAGYGIVKDIPVGADRIFRVSALNSSGRKLYAGEITHVTIDAGSNNVGHIKVRAVNNSSPLAEITSPSDNTSVDAGEVITFSGRGIDPEDGTLSHDVFVWTSSIDGPLNSGNIQFSTGALSAGTHEITLTVTDSAGASNTDSILITISAPSIPEDPSSPAIRPIASAGGPYSSNVGQPVTFDGNGSSDTDGQIVRYAWVFGDGNPGEGAAPTHTYAASGNYTVTLTVTDNDEATDSVTTTVTIIDEPDNQPLTAFAGGPYNGTAGQPVNFNGSGSLDPDGSIVSYVWDFGDGKTGTGVTPEHVYDSAGSFEVILTVTDNEGGNHKDAITVIIASGAPPGKITNSLGMTFIYIPPGTFMMGSPIKELGRDSDENQHQVKLTKGYYVQTTEVTQGHWMGVMGMNPSRFDGCGDRCPVDSVSWDDVQLFINELNRREGTHAYRLPTEAEWEYAARAGSSTAFANGEITEKVCKYDANLDAMGWYCYNSFDTTHPVAQKQANAWNLYDMHGNVWEWCSDFYNNYPSVFVKDPDGGEPGAGRVLRGGSWYADARYCRSASRLNNSPDIRYVVYGFRLVLDAINTETGNNTITDNDGDGYNSGIDCNDSNPDINPGESEICGDGIDQDCSGIDEKCSKYIDNGNGTIADTETGLMWQQATAQGVLNWDYAIEHCESLKLAGYRDWRLPSLEELESLVDTNYYPTINTNYFPDTESSEYWSSTTYDTDSAACVYFGRDLAYYTNKKFTFNVRAVRDEQ